MIDFKKQYKGKIIYIRGYGNIDTNKVTARDIYNLSLLNGYEFLIKYIVKNGKEGNKKTKK